MKTLKFKNESSFNVWIDDNVVESICPYCKEEQEYSDQSGNRHLDLKCKKCHKEYYVYIEN